MVLCDGAMGTMLYARGVFINRCFDELNLSQPEFVRTVHAEYLQAGAEVVETNTLERMRFGWSAMGCAIGGGDQSYRREAGAAVRS